MQRQTKDGQYDCHYSTVFSISTREKKEARVKEAEEKEKNTKNDKKDTENDEDTGKESKRAPATDDRCKNFIDSQQQIPLPIRMILLTHNKLRFLVYNSRKSLVKKLFANITPDVFKPVFEWAKPEEEGACKLTDLDVSQRKVMSILFKTSDMLTF